MDAAEVQAGSGLECRVTCLFSPFESCQMSFFCPLKITQIVQIFAKKVKDSRLQGGVGLGAPLI